MRKTIITLFLLTTGLLHAAAGGQSSALFLEEATSSYHLSLGSLGYSSDNSQMWSNSAALYDRLRGRTFTFSLYTSNSDLNQNFFYGGYAWPEKYGKFAFGFAYLGNSDLKAYDKDGNFSENFSTGEMLGGLSHFWRLNSFLAFGETVKAYYFDYHFASQWAFAADISALYSPLPFLDIGFALDNLVSTQMQYAVESETIPVTFDITPSVSFMNGRGRVYYGFRTFPQIYSETDMTPEHRAGIEFDFYRDYISGRAGYNGSGFTVGLGTKIQQYHLSVAYLPTAYENRVGFTFSFDVDTVGSGPFARPDDIPDTDVEEELLDFYEGMESYNNGNYKNAYNKFNRVIEINPDHQLAYRYRERALLHLKTTDWLDQEQQKLIKLHKNLARKYEGQGNYGEAIFEWRKVLELNPVDSEAPREIDRIKDVVKNKVLSFHRQGLERYAGNDKIAAIELFSSALNLNPEYEPSKNWLIKIKQELSQAELKERERIERLQKAEVFYNRGLSYYGRKTYEEAIKQFDQALLLNPGHINAKKYRRMAAEELEAERKGLRGIKAANAFYEKGMKNFTAENFYDSVRDFRFALKAFPAHKDANRMLPKAEKRLQMQIRPFLLEGKAFYRNKKFADAKQKFTAALKLNPDSEEAQKYLTMIDNETEATISFHMAEGKSNFSRNNYSKTIYHMNEVVQLDPGNSEAKSILEQAQAKVKGRTSQMHRAALADYKAGRFSQAIAGWEKVLALDPANALAKKYLAEAQSKQKVTKYGTLISKWNKQGKTYFQNRDYSRALTLFEKVLEIDPNDKTARQYKALCKEEIDNEKKRDRISKLFIDGVRDYKRREYDDAIKKWREVKKLDPQNRLVDKYITRAIEGKKNRKIIDYINGEKFYKQGKWLLARSSFERAIEEDPTNEKARNRLQDTLDRIAEEKISLERSGDKKMRESDYIGAAQDYLAAYRLDNSAEMARKRENAVKAQELFEQGVKYYNSERDIGLSIEPFLKVLEINPFDKKASEYIAKAKEKGKDRLESWLQQAEEAEENEKYRSAYSLYRSVQEIAPGNIEMKKGLARTRRKLREKASAEYKEGKEAMALKNYTLAIEKFSATEKILSDYEDTDKLLNEAREKLAAQKRQARQSSGGSSGGGTSSAADQKKINRGILLYRQGKYRQAIQVWSGIPKSSASYSKARKYIARARLKL